MGPWSLEDIPWGRFDRSKVNPEILRVVKAASMVEYNAGDYRTYLTNVFRDDERVVRAIDQWAAEEVQHGRALGRWAELADPEFDFESSFRRFTNNFRVQFDATESIRGSRAGEMVARCMVETGTNSFYTALADATGEPVLREICRRIADDEYAHYCLFHKHMERYLALERLSTAQRLSVAFDRLAESEDDELATAYWAANGRGEHYDRRANAVAYARATLRFYRPEHIRRGVDMIFNAVGLRPGSVAAWVVTRCGRAFIWYRTRFVPRLGVLRARLSSRVAPRSAMAEQRL